MRGLGLRDVDRLLLLVDAGLHAVVADAVAGRRQHRIVDRDDRQRADRVALRLQHVHLGDLLFERAAGERHAERRLLERAGLAVFRPLRATVLALVVAPDAVVGLVERLLVVHAGVGEREAVAARQSCPRQAQHGDAVALDGLHRHKLLEVEFVRHLEQRAATMRAPVRRQRRPGGIAQRRVQPFLRPSRSQVSTWAANEAPSASRPSLFKLGAQRGSVEGGGIGVFLDGLSLHEQPLAAMDRVESLVWAATSSSKSWMPNSSATKASRIGPSVTAAPPRSWRPAIGGGPGGEKVVVKGRVLLFEPGEEEAIEPDQAVPVPQIVKGEPEAERLFHTCLVGVHLPEPSCTMWGTPRPIWP